MIPVQPLSSPGMAPHNTDAALKGAALALEASFLAEMLKAAGLGKQQSSFSGGAGEDQFASFLVDEHAKLIAQSGGIGLAEALFETLKDRQHG